MLHYYDICKLEIYARLKSLVVAFDEPSERKDSVISY